MRISDWSSDVCSFDLPTSPTPDSRSQWQTCPEEYCGCSRREPRRPIPRSASLRNGRQTIRTAPGRRVPLPETSGSAPNDSRSEEHTSELQSLMRISYAVFCLKKKNKKIEQQNNRDISRHQHDKPINTNNKNTTS